MLGNLSRNYESNGDPSCISTGLYDLGGKSYGMYQFSEAMGVLVDFVNWYFEHEYPQGALLLELYPCATEFDSVWKQLGKGEYRELFKEAQHNYVQERYYEPAIKILAENYFHIENHNEVMKDVVWSRAVQYGVGNILEMFTEACTKLGYPNLSYIDAKNFDKELIESIYLNVCRTEEWTNGSPALREGLYYRFESECEEAVSLLE